MKPASYWIEKLNLKKHPEGGWFREVYRSVDTVPVGVLHLNFTGTRHFSTSIYYLLENQDISVLHRIKSDELWHYYTGNSAVEIISVENGELNCRLLGNNFEQNEHFQIVVPKNTWFGAKLTNMNGYALVGCTVSPGFCFDDFELANKSLLKEFPSLAGNINRFIK